MCTLDVMGYAAEQFYTVPYLVMAKAIEKEFDSSNQEAQSRMYRLIEQTCTNMIK